MVLFLNGQLNSGALDMDGAYPHWEHSIWMERICIVRTLYGWRVSQLGALNMDGDRSVSALGALDMDRTCPRWNKISRRDELKPRDELEGTPGTSL